MKTKKLFWIVLITAIIITVILFCLRVYYVAVALLAGTLVLRYREIWSLIRRRELPVIDERIRANTNRAIRNGFVYFAVVTAFLMLPFSVILTDGPETVHVLAGLFLSTGFVYFLSYVYFDHVEPKLDERALRILNRFLVLIGISVGVFIISVFLHNAISGLLGNEEPVFFIIAVFVSPLALAVGIIGSLVVFIKGILPGKP